MSKVPRSNLVGKSSKKRSSIRSKSAQRAISLSDKKKSNKKSTVKKVKKIKDEPIEKKVKKSNKVRKDKIDEEDRIEKELSTLQDTLDEIGRLEEVTIFRPKYASWTDVVNLLSALITPQRYGEIEIHGSYYIMTPSNIHDLIDVLEKGMKTKIIQRSSANVTISETSMLELLVYNPVDEINFRYMKRQQKMTDKSKRQRVTGSYFPYYHNTDLDLSKYQIYKEDDEVDTTPCLIYCMQMAKLPKEVIQSAKLKIKHSSVALIDMEEIATHLDIKIRVLIMYSKRSEYKVYNTNKKAKYSLEVILAKGHYLINDMTDVKLTTLENYRRIKNDEEPLDEKRSRPISAKRLIRFLLENEEDYLTNITERECKDVDAKTIETLEYQDRDVDQATYVPKNDLNTKDHHVAFLCFRTYMEDEIYKGKERLQLKEFMACAKVFECDTFKLLEENHYIGIGTAGLKFLESLTKDTIIYTDSLKCDMAFLIKWLFGTNLDEKGTTISGGQGLFKNHKTKETIKIYVRDLSKLIPIESEDYVKTFLTENEQSYIKEDYIGKKYYDSAFHDERYVKIKKVFEFIPKNKRYEFQEIIKDLGLVHKYRKDEFDHLFYCQKMGNQEVDVMSKSFFKFREWMLDITEIDILNYKTLANFSNDYLLKEGCYEGVYKFEGIVEEFIRRSLSGGRNMMCDNEPSDSRIKKSIQILDGISLYPSAMTLMEGFLKGKPKILKTTKYDEIKKYDGYFVEIEIIKIGKNLAMPLLSRKNEEGTREYTNLCLGKHVVSKFCLEDLIKYQKIEFKIIKGYYFDEGRNNKINEVMNKLFQEKKKNEVANNKMKLAYKFLMNSSYGYTILRKSDYTMKYFDTIAKADAYIYTNRAYIDYYNRIDGTTKTRVKVKRRIDTAKTIPQVGVEILDRAKRIMNEVICLAEDNKLKVYYTDTDSIHMGTKDIRVLEKLYKNEYGKELIGDQLGQFHFDIKPPEDFKNYDKGVGLKAVESIYCKRKVYGQKIQCMVDGQMKYFFNFKMKGIPQDAIERKVKEKYEKDPMKMYEDILERIALKFNLSSGEKIRLSYKKDFTICVVEKFNRTISM